MNLTSKIRRALNKLDLSPLQVGVVDIGILPGWGGLRRGDTLSCLQSLISPTPHHASISALGGGVGLASSKRFGGKYNSSLYRGRLGGGLPVRENCTVIQSPQGEESPSLKSLEVEKFRSLGEFTVIQSPKGEESRSSTFREGGVTC